MFQGPRATRPGRLAGRVARSANTKGEAILVPHATAGVEVRYWHVALGAEAQVAALNTFQARLSAVF